MADTFDDQARDFYEEHYDSLSGAATIAFLAAELRATHERARAAVLAEVAAVPVPECAGLNPSFRAGARATKDAILAALGAEPVPTLYKCGACGEVLPHAEPCRSDVADMKRALRLAEDRERAARARVDRAAKALDWLVSDLEERKPCAVCGANGAMKKEHSNSCALAVAMAARAALAEEDDNADRG